MKRKLKYNLQFFAEEATGVEEPGAAEPVEVEESGGTEEVTQEETTETEPQKQIDVNAIAAAARRKAEEDAKARQANIDAEYARRFGNFKNPITGKPIQTQAEYLEALDAQSQIQAEEQLRQNGVDPSILNQMIANHPAVRQSEALVAQTQRLEVEQRISADIAELGKLDASIKSFADIPEEVIQRAMSTGVTLVDAYKVVNYGKVNTANREAIQQAAINQAKNKQHMTPINGVATNDGLKEIPVEEVAKWKAFYPDASMEELKKKYNRVNK